MNEMSTDEQLGLTVGELAYGMSIPNFLKKVFRIHCKGRFPLSIK